MFRVWGDAVDVPFDQYRWGLFFVRVNQVLVRLWARNQLSGLGCWLLDIVFGRCLAIDGGTGRRFVVRLHV